MRLWILLVVGMVAFTAGCGSTRTTDTLRSATEQLLISDAVDRALEKMSFKQLSGFTVFLDTSRVSEVTDRDYLIGAVRQKLATEGAALREERSEADVVVELFVGALGTNRYEWFVGVPQVTLPPGALPSIPFLPELPIVKEIKQQGVAKIETFAYDAETGIFIAHSGSQRSGTNNKSIYFLGLGPFESGSVTERIKLAGNPLPSFGNQTDQAKLPGLAARPEGWNRRDRKTGKGREAPRAKNPASRSAQGRVGAPSRPVSTTSKGKPQPPSSRPRIRLFFKPEPDKTVSR